MGIYSFKNTATMRKAFDKLKGSVIRKIQGKRGENKSNT